MNVQPISYVPSTNYYNKLNSQKPVNNLQFNDTVSFTGYESVLKKMASAELERESHVEEHFQKLMQAIWTDSNISKSKIFGTITDMYTKKGLRGMLMEFWKANPSSEVQKIIDEFGNKVLMTIAEKPQKKGNLSVVKLVDLGKHGFWNNIFGRKEAPRDVRLSFHDNVNSIELYLDKKGDLAIQQTAGADETYTAFHSLTGHRKVTVESCGELQPETTFYKKNGKRNFWKNFFLGGIAAEAIY